MARSLLLLGVLLGLVLATGLAAVALRSRLDHGPVYTVAQVQAQLARRPRAWTNRALLLRGVAEVAGCVVDTPDGQLLCGPARAVLGDAGPPPTGASLPLALAGSDPLLAVVRRVPLLGGLLPAGQMVHWGEVATYRVELRVMPDQVCGAATCYGALLLDAAPTSSGEG
jgi:hypothetical protein